MKSISSMRTKLVSCLLILVILPQSAIAGNICFNNISSARGAASEIKYQRENADFWSKKYNFCDQDRTNLSTQNDTLHQEVAGLKQDKVLLNTVVGDYKKQYLDTTQALIKEQQDKPSRFTWFAVGAITTAVAVLAGIFAIK